MLRQPPCFVPGRITIQMQRFSTGLKEAVEIDAELLDGLAVHGAMGLQSDDGQPTIAITHIASGLVATPMYFDAVEKAKAAAVAMLSLPVDWDRAAGFDRPYLGKAIVEISALCEGFYVETPIMAEAAGSA